MRELNGNWKIGIKFLWGEARHSVQLAQNGQELKGRYRSQYSEQEVRGRVVDDRVEMEVGIYYQGVGTTYRFRGKCEGEVLRGEVELGEYGTATWEAERLA